MHILLINTNPVVSRLFVLCAEEADITLKEVSTVDNMQDEPYTMIFVDDSVYDESMIEFFETFENIKKVFISYTNKHIDGFDFTIEKPFLPSTIIEIFENHRDNATVSHEEDEQTIVEEVDDIMPTNTQESAKDNTNILDIDEIEKIKHILKSDEEEELEDLLSEEDIEKRKVELIKKQLIDEGVEIVEENEIVSGLNIDSYKKPVQKKSKKKKKSKQTKIILTDEEMHNIEHILRENLTKKQMKRLLQGKKITVSMKLRGNRL